MSEILIWYLCIPQSGRERTHKQLDKPSKIISGIKKVNGYSVFQHKNKWLPKKQEEIMGIKQSMIKLWNYLVQAMQMLRKTKN